MIFFWIRPASEQGSFCDTTSHIHYNNRSRDETMEAEETAVRRGDTIMNNGFSLHRYNEAVRFNTNITEVDEEGYDHPIKYSPGK